MGYLLRHSEELSKYFGKCVAIVRDELIAVGKDRVEAYKKAKQKYLKEKIAIFYIPTEEETVPLLWITGKN